MERKLREAETRISPDDQICLRFRPKLPSYLGAFLGAFKKYCLPGDWLDCKFESRIYDICCKSYHHKNTPQKQLFMVILKQNYLGEDVILRVHTIVPGEEREWTDITTAYNPEDYIKLEGAAK